MSRTPQGERLELVTDFASLRAGDLCVLRWCSCGREERFILLNLSPCPCASKRCGGLSWETLPPCPEDGNGRLSGDESSGRLYRVITDPPAKEREVALPKKLERVK